MSLASVVAVSMLPTRGVAPAGSLRPLPPRHSPTVVVLLARDTGLPTVQRMAFA